MSFHSLGSPVVAVITTTCKALQADRLEYYVNAVERTGCSCLLIPVSQNIEGLVQILSFVDGIILTGGGDVDPTFYGESHHTTTYGVDQSRDEAEFAIVRHSFAHEKPLLGICRGAQVMVVSMGGSLHTHLPENSDVHHRLATPGHLLYPIVHRVQIVEKSQLHDIVEESSYCCLSYHHCAVKTLPLGCQASAFADDGMIESIEFPEIHPFAIGVQWHPELGTSVADQRIFSAFIEASSQYRIARSPLTLV
jgi:putative glutamine amidotransferase